MIGRPWGKTKITIAACLLISILFQMVHLQIRGYELGIKEKTMVTLDYFSGYLGLTSSCAFDPNQSVYSGQKRLKAAGNGGQDVLGAWLVSPGYSWFLSKSCRDGVIVVQQVKTWNRYLFLLTVMFLILMSRFLTSSWMVSLVVGASLMHREALWGRIGVLGVDSPLTFLFTLWFASTVHFFRTGAGGSLFVSAATVVIGATFSLSFAGLGLTIPCLLGVGYFSRKQLATAIRSRLRSGNVARRQAVRRGRRYGYVSPGDRDSGSVDGQRNSVPYGLLSGLNAREIADGEGFGSRLVSTVKWMVGLGVPETPSMDLRRNIERGSFFRSILAPFGYWVYRKSRWKRLVAGWVLVTAAIGILAFGLFHLGAGRIAAGRIPDFLEIEQHLWGVGHLSLWFAESIEVLDVVYVLSIAVVGVCAFQSPADGLISFFEAVWCLAIAVIGVLLLAGVFDMLDQAVADQIYAAAAVDIKIRMAASQVFVWVEPLVLSMGIIGVYNLIKVADSRLAHVEYPLRKRAKVSRGK